MSLSQQKLGFHYYPDTDHYGETDLHTWLPVLTSAGASWLTLQGNAGSIIPESFIRPLVAAAINPIVHITAPVGSVRMAQVYTALHAYAEWGVQHVVFFDRPNVRTSWPSSNWTHDALINRFAETLIPILEAQNEMGLTPVLPPLEPGGDYWDTAFLENALALINERASEAVKTKLTLAVYIWSYGHALDWGQGGSKSWPDSRPYGSPEGSEDQRGFQINDWYQEIAEKVMGRRIPLLVMAGGAGPTEIYDTPEAIQMGNNEVASHLALHDLAEDILNFNFYPLATARGHRDFQAAWYIRPSKLENSTGAKELPSKPTSEKEFEHYVLLGLSNQTNGLRLWDAIAPLAMSLRPTIGFSLEEAKRAARVSLVGDLDALPASIEQELQECGSVYERFDKWDSDEFLIAASDWAANKSVLGVNHD